MTKTEFDNKLTKKDYSLINKDYNFFLGRTYFASNDGFQKMFVYYPTFNVLELRIDKGTEYIIGWKSKGFYNFKLIALHSAFLLNVKYFGNKFGKKNCKCLHRLLFR